MVRVDRLRVFTGPGAAGGNPLAVVCDGHTVRGQDDRIALAAELGLSETVFVDDAEHGVVDIYTPSARLPFGGHPLIGVSWWLRRHGHAVTALRCPAGRLATWEAGEFVWIRAEPGWATGRRTWQLPSAADVEALPSPPAGHGWLYAWAWEEENRGRVRARGFPRRGDSVAEDEATGAAALALTAQLRRCLDIRQGSGSQILTSRRDDAYVEIGGRVAFDP